MANSETKIGQLVIDLKVKTEALEKGLETAKKQLQEIENENNNLKNSNSSIDASFIALAGSITATLASIKNATKSAVEEYKAHEQAMSSLQNVADYTGNSMSDLTKITKKYESVMNKSDIATTVKNFTLMGMSVEETDEMIQSLTNSAIRNRNANYTVSEAVRVASEGYRQGLSTLSDSAGVTENLSVMLDKYAQSIGKTASQLTEEEKNQAYVNRTMAAAEPFARAMEGYLDSLAGKQGEYSQALRETQVAYAEAIEPMLIKFTEFKTNMISGLGDIISEHKSAATGVVTFVATLSTLSLGIIAVQKAMDLYKKSTFAATVAQEGLNAAIKANPAGLIATGIALLVSAYAGLTIASNEQEASQSRLNEVTERYNQIKNGTIEYTDENIANLENDKKITDELIELMEKKTELQNKLNNRDDFQKAMSADNVTYAMGNLSEETKNIKKELDDVNKQIKENKKNFEEYGNAIDKLKEKTKTYSNEIEKVTSLKKAEELVDNKNIKNQLAEAAKAKNTAKQYQELFKVYQKGETKTKAYKNAVAELTKKFPEAVSQNGIVAKDMKALIDSMASDADISWANTQNAINQRINDIETAIKQCDPELDPNGNYAASLAAKIGVPTQNVIGVLQTALNLMNMLLDKKPEEVTGGASEVTIPKTSGGGSSKASKSYSNKKLDNYKAEIEYKKSLDKLSLQQEIAMYKKALKSYAKTTEEKRDLRVKIYELNKELAQKEKEMLDQQTEDYENYIQDQINSRGSAYDIKEQTKDYDKIISMHKKYLKQIMKDERLSLDERKEIYREELQTVREYEQQKRDLRVEAVDNTVSQLTDALTKQLEEMQEKDKEAIDKNIEEVEKWKDARIEAINEEYDARIEAIEKELEALDKAEEEKTRAEEDAEYERKKNRLEELIAFEHDATTKANYQKELNKLIEDYQKTLDKRALDDKKDALEEQKDLLQEEQDSRIDEIEKEAEAQKEAYEKQLDELEKYYEEQIDMAQDTAEKMLLNVQKNQDQILELLKKYGNAYEITGQSLGEKLAQGLEKGMAGKIESFIQKMQDKIDSSIESKIKEWTSSNYKYNSSEGKPQTNTINITQQNYIQQMPETPSETYRKLNAVSEKLAEELSG